jgi:PiT family inorganic phosphate transporter
LGAGVYVGWNIGANDTANCMGTSVGCGLISFRNAVILVAIFSIFGALLQGQYVMNTIGRGIVKTDLSYLAVIIALLCSGFFVFSKIIVIAESWVICPLMVMGLSFGLMHLLKLILRRFETGSFRFQNALGWLAIGSACYVAFSMGANNAGNAVGPITNLGILHPKLLLLMGGLSIAVGAATYGRKVADTIGKGITPLDIPGAFVAQVSSAFGMHLFSLLGIPVSTSSAIVGAVVGVGLVKGMKAISKKTIVTILLGWLLTPTFAAASAYLLYKLIKAFFA